MNSMLKSSRVLRLETLLRDAKVFVGRCSSIGAQQLSGQIAETLAKPETDQPHASEVQHALAVLRDAANSENPTLFWGEAMQHLRVLLADYDHRVRSADLILEEETHG
jgi:hypothetical protein